MKWLTSIIVLRGVKTSLFLLTVIGVSSLLSLSSPRPVQAEGLFDGLRCSVVKLLGRPCQPTNEPINQSPPPASSEETVSAKDEDKDNSKESKNETSAPPQPVSHATTNESSNYSPPSLQPVQQPVALEPIQLDQELLEEIPPIASLQSAVPDSDSLASVATFTQSSDDSSTSTLGQVAPIKASKDGWMIFGVSWIWWLSAAVLLVAGGYAGTKVIKDRKHIKLAK